ncbi:hypothetical protein RhiJN_20067 [Ceratobasidium sp. AG-Ba]|nr:hypothetical protein RhiJN_20067 [Ceratobasidium sp. AG-Ba]
MPPANNPPPKTKHVAPDDMQTPTRPSKQYSKAPAGPGVLSETTSRNACTPIEDPLKRMTGDEQALLLEIKKTQKQQDEDSGTPSPVKTNKPAGSNSSNERHHLDSDEESSPKSLGKSAHRTKIVKA